uniref:Laccase n=1 Tax=Arion vulgaris TaxID=1028688 RepID=A0A0B6Z3I0_9EUPU
MKTRSLILMYLIGCLTRAVTPCLITDDTCEFWLEIQFRMTMMNDRVAVYPANGLLYSFDVMNITEATPVDLSNVISADGWEKPRLVIVANGTMPGPPIEVFEGQNVIVHVKNLLHSDSVTIHWHGLHQRETPWMDGVAFVTQCPISPGESFTYRFKADPSGTFWYHSHIGSQLSMGLLGPLIVREKVPPSIEEFTMMLQDWNHDFDGDMIHLKMLLGNYENRRKISPTGSLEGGLFSMFPFQSGLINGRGRFFNANGTHNEAPLTIYTVKESKSYRFRVIGAGSLYPFRVSIDEHTIKLVETDGYTIQPVFVESFIINPGERYDFEITANQSIASYWIRAQTLEINVQNHIALAILKYEGATDQEPTTTKKTCSNSDRCLVVNCPFSYYPDGTFTDCKQIGDLKSLYDSSTPGTNSGDSENINDIFLNFAFPGTTWTPASVNGIQFQTPTVSALTQPQEVNTICDPTECGEEKVCKCTYTLNLEDNKVYQMVFLNMGGGRGWAHPIHMHGHSFHVLKIGFPNYDQLTGKVGSDNLDIDCHGNPNRTQSFCNSASWANKTWGGNNIPGLELKSPVKKDTIIVPTGGYAVVRIQADNPGVWFMHCHIELHSSDGMAVMLNESFSNQKPSPAGFPRCGSFNYDGKTAPQYDKRNRSDDVYDKKLFWIVVGSLIGVIIVISSVAYWKLRRVKLHGKSVMRTTEGGHLNLSFRAN